MDDRPELPPSPEWDEITYVAGEAMYYDRQGKPCSARTWARLFPDRRLAYYERDGWEVITVYHGTNQQPFDADPPVIFGSIIHSPDNEWTDETETATEQEAMLAHRTLIAKVTATQAPRR